MPKQIQYIKEGQVIAQLDLGNSISIPDHDTTNEVWVTPERVTRWQFKQACAEKESPLPGFANLELLIDYMLSQMPEGDAKQRAYREWKDANNIERASATIEALRQQVNQIAQAEVLTVADVDELFIKAEQIDA